AGVKIGILHEQEEWVERAVQMRPYDVRALILMGRLKLRHPDTSMVVGLGNRAVSAFPNSIEARDLLISALDLQSRYEEAAKQALELLERKPPAPQRAKLHRLVGELYATFLNNPGKAIEHYKLAVQ